MVTLGKECSVVQIKNKKQLYEEKVTVKNAKAFEKRITHLREFLKNIQIQKRN